MSYRATLPLLFLLARCASAPAEEAQTTAADVADTAADGEDTSAAEDTIEADLAPHADTATGDTTIAADTEQDAQQDTQQDTEPDAEQDAAPPEERADLDRDGDHIGDAHDLDPDDPRIGLQDEQPANTSRLIVAAAPTGTPYLAGDFNGWTQTPMTVGPLGLFEATVTPLSGSSSLQYKFTAGDWSREESAFRGPANNRRLSASSRASAAIIRAWGSDPLPASTAIGNLRLLADFAAPELGRTATVRLLLPPGYDATDRHYPVLYMQDGQNLFDNASAAFGVEWQADEAAWVGQLEGAHSGLIIVGIDNSANRSCDYTPFAGAIGCETGTPLGEAYADFLANTLKPAIDRQFRTLADRRNTFVGGSSRGGLAALVTALRHQETFSAVMGLSATTLSAITGGDFAAYAASHPRRAPIRFSLDYGDAEVVYGNNATLLIGAMNSAVTGLTAAGFDSAAITTAIIPGAVHNEAAWAARLPGRLAWLLDPTAP